MQVPMQSTQLDRAVRLGQARDDGAHQRTANGAGRISRLSVASGARSAGQQGGTGILPVDARQGTWARRPCHLRHRQSGDEPNGAGCLTRCRFLRNQMRRIFTPATIGREADSP